MVIFRVYPPVYQIFYETVVQRILLFCFVVFFGPSQCFRLQGCLHFTQLSSLLPSVHANSLKLLTFLIGGCITQQTSHSLTHVWITNQNWKNYILSHHRDGSHFQLLPPSFFFYPACTIFWQAWHAWAVMNFEAVLHYKHQSQARDEKKKLRHASGASANSEASNSDSEVDSNDQSPAPSPGQKKVNEVRMVQNEAHIIEVHWQSGVLKKKKKRLICRQLKYFSTDFQKYSNLCWFNTF